MTQAADISEDGQGGLIISLNGAEVARISAHSHARITQLAATIPPSARRRQANLPELVEATPPADPDLDIGIRLRPVFHAVQNETNWKNPIDAFVSADRLAETVIAIEFFTGGKTTVSYDGGREAFHVTSPGYYAIIGA